MKWKVLTLTQPYASLVALLAKGNETRGWRTHYRGPLLIHAAAGLGPVGGVSGLIDLCSEEPFRSVLQAAGIWQGGVRKDRLPRGAIVASCELIGCYPTARTDDGAVAYVTRAGSQHKYRELVVVGKQERAFGDYALGRWVWVLKNVRALPKPLPCKGALRLWEYEGEVLL